ncbi:G2/M phase-specific E3 ubiquitin-protein ligase-like [Gallus gallus]|nr:G2/M phase-specific E3 ubiquitin-protein ligase-like [Gallus gallus]XP_040514489.1 G2/M phase-specific E3 ubiquitin-protein ligase-like [Gallus gallus]
MSKRKEKTSHSEEQVCMLCRRADVHPDICGPTLSESGLCVHKFCLFFANGLYEHTALQRAVLKFPLDAIRCTIEEAEQKHCFVCGEKGASICCAETGCERSFHLPCATDGECVTHFFGRHRSFCCEHRPQQIVEADPEPDTACIICLEPVGDKKSYHTMVCPVCIQAWFHRSCIQGQAMSAGILRFQCPVCRDRMQFRMQMHILGIQIPARRPTWEDKESYEKLYEMHGLCDVSECLYTEGREQAEEEGPWELLVCTSCAVQGTHRHCSSLSESITSWECDICAGVGTASSDEPQLAGPSTASQEAEGPSPSSPEPGNHRSDSTSKAASESPCGSQLPKRSSLSSQPRTGQSKSRGHTSKQHQGHQGSSPTPAPGAESSPRGSTSKREVGSSRNCPAAERRRQSGQQDTGRTRSRSPLKDRASNSPSQLRRNPGSRRSAASATVSGRRTAASATVSGRRTPAPGAESSTHTSGSRRASRNSPGAGSIRCHKEQGTSRRQSQSSLQGPASNSSSQPRGRRGSRLSAESGSQSSGRQVTSRSSRDSALPEHRRHSQNQERSRSPRDRRASNSPRQSGGSQSRSPRQRRPSQARHHSQNQP